MPSVQVVAADGRVVSASADSDDPGGRWFVTPGAHGGPSTRVVTVDNGRADADDGPYRVAVVSTSSPEGPVTVYAAQSTRSVDESISELVAVLSVGIPVVVLALALAGWLLVGRALRPVETMRRQVAAIPGTEPGRRLEQPPARDELGRLAATFNELLARIEASTGRQRQFVADAAHELRSPIAALQAQAEVFARHPQVAATPAAQAGMLADTQRLARLVDDLLALARLDAHPHPPRQVVDLDDLVLQEVRRAGGRGPTVRADQMSAGRVLGDPAALDRVVRNLLDNAVRHATATVTVRLDTTEEMVTLVVADDGPGIPSLDRDRVFERFTRLDDSRSRDAGGAGLGLAIVRDVVESHGGRVQIQDNQPGARFTVVLPATS